MTATQLERLGYRHPLRPDSVITSFSVEIVDGNGIDVAGEPLTVLFSAVDGTRKEIRAVTDTSGRARFVEEHAIQPIDVTVFAGRETTGPIQPWPGARIVIET